MTDRDEGRTLRAIEAMATEGRNDPLATLDAIKAAASEALRAPTSDTEDVGEKLKTIRSRLDLMRWDADHHTAGLLTTTCEELDDVLARLRRTPETELDALDDMVSFHESLEVYRTDKGFEASLCIHDGATTDRMSTGATIIDALRALATQDPNAGGEDG